MDDVEIVEFKPQTYFTLPRDVQENSERLVRECMIPQRVLEATEKHGTFAEIKMRLSARRPY